MSESDPGKAAERLLAINDRLIRRLQTASVEEWTRRPSPEEWTAAEVAGHMAELEVHWARMAASVASQPGLDIGRPLDNPRRLEGPTSGATRSLSDGIAHLAQAGKDAASILRSIPANGWSAQGQRDGEPRIVADIVQRSILEHAHTHVEQCLAALQGKTPS
jgi:hypothetical protein